jgi:hypothetical protein
MLVYKLRIPEAKDLIAVDLDRISFNYHFKDVGDNVELHLDDSSIDRETLFRLGVIIGISQILIGVKL